MKKFLVTVCCIMVLIAAQSQTTPTPATDTVLSTINVVPTTETQAPKKWGAIDLSNRSNDHFMVQYGFDNWSGKNDSVNPQGFSRHFNIYFMLDKPFKTNPKFSVGIGAGIGSSNMFFESTNIDVKSASTRLPFTRLDSTNHFKKYKLTTVFLEAPIELRYNSNPLNTNRSFKIALGVKVGTLINAHTKGKTLVDKNGTTLNSYIAKENSKRFFNSTKVAGTARIGYGIFSLHGAYQLTALLKDEAGPVVRPYSIGITLSGL